jgi:hypothetical protein
VVTKLRERATNNRAEALSQAEILDDLFELRMRDAQFLKNAPAAGRTRSLAAHPALESAEREGAALEGAAQGE